MTSSERSRTSTSEVSKSAPSRPQHAPSRPQHASLPEATNDSITSMRPLNILPLNILPHDEVLMSPADAAKPDDSEMKKNLMSMISGSQDRKRKTRALPNIQGMPPLKSPTKSPKPEELLPHTPQGMKPKHPLSPVTLEQPHGIDALKSESLPSTPVESLTLEHSRGIDVLKSEGSNPVGSLTVKHSLATSPVNSGLKSDNSLPLSPVEHLQSESPLQKSPDGHLQSESPLQKSPGGHLKIEYSHPVFPLSVKTEPDPILRHESPPPAVKSLQPPVPLSPLVGPVTSNTSSLAVDEDPKLSGLTSETMIVQLPEDGSSSSDFEARNVVPLGLEMESKKNAQPISSDDSVDGSGNSVASDILPTRLGHVSDSIRQEVVATSLPDLDDQYQANQK